MTNGDNVVDYRNILDGWRRVEVVHQGGDVADACWAVEIGNKEGGLHWCSEDASCRRSRHVDDSTSVL